MTFSTSCALEVRGKSYQVPESLDTDAGLCISMAPLPVVPCVSYLYYAHRRIILNTSTPPEILPIVNHLVQIQVSLTCAVFKGGSFELRKRLMDTDDKKKHTAMVF